MNVIIDISLKEWKLVERLAGKHHRHPKGQILCLITEGLMRHCDQATMMIDGELYEALDVSTPNDNGPRYMPGRKLT